MCASGGNAQCDSMMDRSVITKILNDLTETIKEISPKVERVQSLAKVVCASVEHVEDCLDMLKSGLSEDFQGLEELFKDVKKPLYADLYREAAVKCEIFIHADYTHLLNVAMGADMKPTNAALLRNVLEALQKFVEFTSKGLDKAVALIKVAEKVTESYFKDQKGMREDVTKRLEGLKELVKAESLFNDT